MDNFSENIQICVTVELFPTNARKQRCMISTSKKTLVKRTVTWLSANIYAVYLPIVLCSSDRFGDFFHARPVIFFPHGFGAFVYVNANYAGYASPVLPVPEVFSAICFWTQVTPRIGKPASLARQGSRLPQEYEMLEVMNAYSKS